MTAGPRIYPSGAMITASGGHGDLRPLSDIPSDGKLTVPEQTGASIIADGPDAVRMRVREQLLQGASQIKLMGSGGVSTPRSPLELGAASPRPSCAPAWRRRATGRPTSRCTPIRRSRSSARSPPAPGASSTAI